jgi:hypothetical protein
MNRSRIFEACSLRLATLAAQVEMLGKLNVLNVHLHCEDFYAHLLNLVYRFDLKNINAVSQNADGFDLIDESARLLLQVSSTSTTQKVKSSLGKDLARYAGYGFRFMSISKDAAHLRSAVYPNPHGLIFDPKEHIYDIGSLLKVLMHMSLTEQRIVYDFLRMELRDTDQAEDLRETNVAAVINLLAAEKLESTLPMAAAPVFHVEEKIAFNNLTAAAGVIDDYKLHHVRVDRIYTEFDKLGSNKSKSVLDAFRNSYHKLGVTYAGDELFFQVVEQISSVIEKSSNYQRIPLEEMQLCVNVLAVDAFIRCKIFKSPVTVNHAPA